MIYFNNQKIEEANIAGKIQEEKRVDINTSGLREVTPDNGYDAMKKINIDTKIICPEPQFQGKTVEITSNGQINVYPDEGFDAMNYVMVNTNVPTCNLQENKTFNIFENGNYTILPDALDGMKKVTVNCNVSAKLVPEAMARLKYDVEKIYADDEILNNYGINLDILSEIENGVPLYEIMENLGDKVTSLPIIKDLDAANYMEDVFRYKTLLQTIPYIDCSRTRLFYNVFPSPRECQISSMFLDGLGGPDMRDNDGSPLDFSSCRFWWKDLDSFQKTMDSLYDRASASLRQLTIILPSDKFQQIVNKAFPHLSDDLASKGYILQWFDPR